MDFYGRQRLRSGDVAISAVAPLPPCVPPSCPCSLFGLPATPAFTRVLRSNMCEAHFLFNWLNWRSLVELNRASNLPVPLPRTGNLFLATFDIDFKALLIRHVKQLVKWIIAAIVSVKTLSAFVLSLLCYYDTYV